MSVGGGARWLWAAAGVTLVSLGLLGSVLPVLPTTPFLLGALFCFTRSSPRLERWLVEHPRFGPPLRAWREEGAIPARVKRLAVATMLVSCAVTAVFAPRFVAVGVAITLLVVGTWIWTRPDASEARLP